MRQVCIDGHIKLADFGLAVKFKEQRQAGEGRLPLAAAAARVLGADAVSTRAVGENAGVPRGSWRLGRVDAAATTRIVRLAAARRRRFGRTVDRPWG